MTWHLNRALTTFRAEVNAAYPRRDKTSDGTIGDAAHQNSQSDHNPDRDGTVDAWDMDVDLRVPNTAAHIERLKQRFQAHEASEYWIHNDQIAGRWDGWRRRPYAYAGPGRNRHTHHVHWNSRDSHQHSTKPWGITEGDEVSEKDVTAALYKPGPYASKGVGAALKKDGWADTSIRAVTEYTWAATRALTAAAKAQDAKLDLILARLTDAGDVEAKVDALAKAEAERAEADRLRDELVLAAVTDDDAEPPAGQTAA